MLRTATCACGRSSISVEGEPKVSAVCHCSNCRRRTGSAFGISAYFEEDAVRGRDGQMNCYAFHYAAQNVDHRRYFCANCGTTLYWYLSDMPGLIGIAGGCFTDLPLSAPGRSSSHSCKLPWVELPSGWQVSG